VSGIVAVQPAKSSKAAVRQQQNINHRKCCMCIVQHKSVNRMIGGGIDWQRQMVTSSVAAPGDTNLSDATGHVS